MVLMLPTFGLAVESRLSMQSRASSFRRGASRASKTGASAAHIGSKADTVRKQLLQRRVALAETLEAMIQADFAVI